jgi:chromosome segregation ATPase
MATETLSYSQLGDRLNWPEAARILVRRLRLPRQKANNGKVLVSVDRSDASLKARIEELEAQLTKAETSAASHRADFERERERCDRLTLELMRAAIETMNAKEAAARLEGELTALRSRPWWRRLVA